MRKSALLLAFLLLPSSPSPRADDEPPLEVRVNRAIDRAAGSLVRRQAEDGSFNKEDKHHPLGRTALSAFTMLHAGYSKDHPAVKQALAFLGISAGYAMPKMPISTYEAGCLVLLLNALGNEHGPEIHRICDWLVENFNRDEGLWGYPDGIPDLSNTQYAVLALKAGERHGYRTDPKIWKRLVDSVIRLQAESGGVRYRGGSLYRATMTHAGALVLLFAREALGGRAPHREIEETLEKGHRWFAEHYSVERNPFGRGWHPGSYYYYLYGLERYAVFFGFDTIAGRDWYREGAEALLARQKKNGEWGNIEETCFAILFLRRATFTEPEARAPGDGKDDGFEDPPQRPRPDASVPYLRDWLVAGPYPGEPNEDDLLYEEQFPVTRLLPRPGAKAGSRKWEAYASAEDKIEFKIPLVEKAWAAYYAAVYLHADEERDAVLWLGSDDGIRAWLDGREILLGEHHDYPGDDFYRVPVHLAKGRNLVLLKVTNSEYYVYFRARISDTEGKPIEGVVDSPHTKRPRGR